MKKGSDLVLWEGRDGVLSLPFMKPDNTVRPPRAWKEKRSLSNYDDHDDDNLKKTIGVISKQQLWRASYFLVHFFDVHCTTTTWNLLIWRFMKDMDIRRRIFFPLFELE